MSTLTCLSRYATSTYDDFVKEHCSRRIDPYPQFEPAVADHGKEARRTYSMYQRRSAVKAPKRSSPSAASRSIRSEAIAAGRRFLAPGLP